MVEVAPSNSRVSVRSSKSKTSHESSFKAEKVQPDRDTGFENFD